MKPVDRNGVLTPICPHCHVDGVLRQREYGHRWECPVPGCDARVGVHKHSPRFAPLGTMARGPLRAIRMQAHDAFDPLWRGARARFPYRNAAYAWLARELEIDVKRCHFGEFDEAMCRRAIAAIAHLQEVPR